MSRYYSKKLRLYARIISGNLCSQCSKVLDNEFHADHVYPHSLGSRHTVEPWIITAETPTKVCVWCVFESYTHSVSVQKLSQRYYF